MRQDNNQNLKNERRKKMNDEQIKKAQQQWAKIIAKAWADEDFKARLIAGPAAVLKEEGIMIPKGNSIKIVENTDKLTHIVLPVRPEGTHIDQLDERVAAFARPCCICMI
jgi:hypothetical protein